jgi:hypothetical protein
MSESSVREFQITNWRPHEAKSLRGFFSLILPSGMIVNDCQFFQKGDRRWINLPTRPYESRGGERKFAPIVEFENREAEDRFATAVLSALDRLFTEANRGCAAPPNNSEAKSNA